MKIGDMVFYLNISKQKGKIESITTKQGVLVGMNLGKTGYIMYQIVPNKEKSAPVQVESAHVHDNEIAAEKHRVKVTPLIKEAESVMSEMLRQIQVIREQVIGPAEFKELAERLSTGL